MDDLIWKKENIKKQYYRNRMGAFGLDSLGSEQGQMEDTDKPSREHFDHIKR